MRDNCSWVMAHHHSWYTANHATGKRHQTHTCCDGIDKKILLTMLHALWPKSAQTARRSSKTAVACFRCACFKQKEMNGLCEIEQTKGNVVYPRIPSGWCGQ